MIYSKTLTAKKDVDFISLGEAVRSDTVTFSIINLTPGNTYQWFIKANTTDADINAIAGNTGTVDQSTETITFALPTADFTVGTTYYFALREFNGSASQEVIQVKFIIAQNAVLGQGTSILNISPLFLPNLTTAERDSYVTGDRALLIYNITTNQVEQYDPNTMAWGGFGGTTSLAASAITVDDTGFQVQEGTNAQAVFNSIDDRLLEVRTSGVRSWTGFSDLGLGVVRINAGEGAIFDGTTYSQPMWSQTDIDLSATDGRYWIYANTLGSVLSTTTELTHEDYRTKVPLARIVIRGGVITGAVSIAMPTQNVVAQIWDIFKKEGLSHGGLALSPVGANLTFQTTGGEIYQAGISLPSSPNNPHEKQYSAINPVTFQYRDQNNVTIGTDRTTLDFANYDNAGVITAIPGASNRASIQLVFAFPTDPINVRILYGQTFYNSINDAVVALNSSYFPIIPANFNDAVFLGFIIGIKGATLANDETQVRFFNNTEFLGGINAAPSLEDVLLASNNLSDLTNTTTARQNLGVEIGVNVQAYSTVLANTTASFTTADETKLDGIEALAEVNNISDVNAIDLTDGGDSTLHFHATDRARANHTGTQLASTISDFNSSVDARITASDKISSDPTGVTGADQITNAISLTQAEYDAIVTPNASTLYVITP